MMIDFVAAGTTVPLRVQLADGATAQTGETVVVSIERVADGYYWNGSTPGWQVGYVTNSMTERTGDAHKAGMYEYDFATPATPGTFDWKVVFDGDIKRTFVGHISTNMPPDVATAIWAKTVDGMSLETLLTVVKALQSGVTVVVDSTVTFRDEADENDVISITYDTGPGERASVTIHI
jgi:hypothetical protein